MKFNIIKSTVASILQENEGARDNDILLMRIALERFGLPTDLKELEKITNANIMESISRARRKVQEQNPFLAPSKETSEKRARHETVIRKAVRL